MKSDYNKKILTTIAVFGCISLIFLFSSDLTGNTSLSSANSAEEGFLLPDIHFIKYSIERLSEIFELF